MASLALPGPFPFAAQILKGSTPKIPQHLSTPHLRKRNSHNRRCKAFWRGSEIRNPKVQQGQMAVYINLKHGVCKISFFCWTWQLNMGSILNLGSESRFLSSGHGKCHASALTPVENVSEQFQLLALSDLNHWLHDLDITWTPQGGLEFGIGSRVHQEKEWGTSVTKGVNQAKWGIRTKYDKMLKT